MDQDPTTEPEDVPQAINDDVRAFLENLTGPSRGRIGWLSLDQARVCIGADRLLRIDPDVAATDSAEARARLSWSGETYEIEALSDADIWVNGRKIGTAHLMHGDMIEFGEDGPMSRFRLCDHTFPTSWPVEEILSDAVAYARTSRRPFGSRLSNALFDSVRRILLETTIVFRVTVILVLVVLTTFVAWQYRSDILLQQSIQEEALRLEVIASTLAETRQEALTASELATLREQLDLQLNTNAERLSVLERRLGASARVISDSTASVAFLQGAYGLRQVESGKLLRHVLGADGLPLRTPLGKPVIDPDGTGNPIEFQFTGTGFLLKDGGQLVTNRHVALPWTNGDRMLAFEQGGLAPEMLKLLVFLPGLPVPVEAALLISSDTADLALLSVPASATMDRGLTLAQGEPEIGDEVIVIGFSTGLRALLAQAGRDFLTSLQETGETNFWTIAARLSEENRIAPLASRGIIAQITKKAVVYDAETTVGGSGAPALDSNGHVVAVNATILPEFGGANIGVPVREVHRLLAETVAN
ncbi:trypsin-like peptidase domain-containing protein [Pseudohalocynthiibacter aestuariivivens]|uniref:Trypsin-like peptidase domain-containing protein n=1 Tax=Pseudohalocynthiibacter aestuariivivens TaxID=1591409 RepID=A0ABV5JE54_9RHOB|nr:MULTISPECIES: trypsin-like peptidase domain-containing protein [Pseudohalocynthiibacter]MBS9717737.1 trypsin-like peptidase domain-containing protein [Pseudohalocynthiibacter aestuariivivens]MCK0104475.1 serine protease [Pseudohalocynthiibacter sp. F2068]